jgi:hypothetical protein
MIIREILIDRRVIGVIWEVYEELGEEKHFFSLGGEKL